MLSSSVIGTSKPPTAPEEHMKLPFYPVAELRSNWPAADRWFFFSFSCRIPSWSALFLSLVP